MTDFIEWLRDFNREPPPRDDVADRIEALSAENERLRGLLSRTIVMAETYAEGTGTQFNEAMAEARAALGETK